MSGNSSRAGSPFHWGPGLINVAVITLIIFAASFLPSDTSLSELRKTGILKVCAPYDAPPLVTSNPNQPGYDIELLAEAASRLGLRLSINRNPVIGADFNARNWGITRSQCELVAGGVIDTPATRGFLHTVPTDIETGWVMIAIPGDMPALAAGRRVGILPGASGLDRTALSRVLRAENIDIALMRTPAQLRESILNDTIDFGITDRFAAANIADGLKLIWLTHPDLPRYSLAIGGWKGDSSLHRALRKQIGDMRDDGTLRAMRDHYALIEPESL